MSWLLFRLNGYVLVKTAWWTSSTWSRINMESSKTKLVCNGPRLSWSETWTRYANQSSQPKSIHLIQVCSKKSFLFKVARRYFSPRNAISWKIKIPVRSKKHSKESIPEPWLNMMTSWKFYITIPLSCEIKLDLKEIWKNSRFNYKARRKKRWTLCTSNLKSAMTS